jgi:hypothetical protein
MDLSVTSLSVMLTSAFSALLVTTTDFHSNFCLYHATTKSVTGLSVSTCMLAASKL